MPLNKTQAGQRKPNKFKKKKRILKLSHKAHSYIISQTLVKWFSEYFTENSSFSFNLSDAI